MHTLKKPLLVVSGITFPAIGGVSNYIDFLTKSLDKVEVLSFNFYNTNKSEIKIVNGKKYYLLKKVYFNNTVLSYPLRILIMAYFIRKLSKSKLIYAQDVGIAGLASLFSFKRYFLRFVGDWAYETYYDKKLISSYYYDFLYNTRESWFLRLLSRFVFLRAYVVITPAHHLKDALLNYYHVSISKIKIIPNFINAFGKHKSLFKRSKKPIFLFVGRFVSYKRFDIALKLFVEFKHYLKDAKLYVIGEGYLKPTYEKIVQDVGLSKDVIFFGSLKKKALYELFEKGIFLLLTSDYEGIPFTALEASYYGVKVVALDKPWIRELSLPGMCVIDSLKDVIKCKEFNVSSHDLNKFFEYYSPKNHLLKLWRLFNKGP